MTFIASSSVTKNQTANAGNNGTDQEPKETLFTMNKRCGIWKQAQKLTRHAPARTYTHTRMHARTLTHTLHTHTDTHTHTYTQRASDIVDDNDHWSLKYIVIIIQSNNDGDLRMNDLNVGQRWQSDDSIPNPQYFVHLSFWPLGARKRNYIRTRHSLWTSTWVLLINNYHTLYIYKINKCSNTLNQSCYKYVRLRRNWRLTFFFFFFFLFFFFFVVFRYWLNQNNSRIQLINLASLIFLILTSYSRDYKIWARWDDVYNIYQHT